MPSGTLMISSKPLEITMGERLIKWNTGRIMSKILSVDIENMGYLSKYDKLNNDIKTIYDMCNSYISNWYGYTYSQQKQLNGDLFDQFTNYLDKLYDFELTDSDPTILAHKAEELFENKAIVKVTSVEQIWIERAKVLEEYGKEIHAIMKAIETGNYRYSEDDKLIEELAIYLEAKGLSLYQIDQELLSTES